ncbi:MAG: hypothetical protein GDA51_06115 [Ekhidna sp.]|nr:hypothetical protein [Ekhidna sp.]
MKRFRLIFHILYILIALAVLYFSIDILVNTQAYLSKIKLSSYVKFPRYIMVVFLFVSILMIVEFVLQQIAVHRAKGNVEELENEILRLKAKLYDKGQYELSENESEEDDLVVDDEEED